jgi:hypothetical protein
VGKKKAARRPSDAVPTDGNGDGDSSQAENGGDESPEVQAVCAAVRRAEAELENARELYEELRGKATDKLRRVRQQRVGDVIDGILDLVKKHPGPGILLSVLAGFFLGRLFRR